MMATRRLAHARSTRLPPSRKPQGGIDSIDSIIHVTGFVASDPSFFEQPTVVNGASDVLGEIFGERGRHTRSAVGVAVLPMNVPVEVEITCRLVG